MTLYGGGEAKVSRIQPVQVLELAWKVCKRYQLPDPATRERSG